MKDMSVQNQSNVCMYKACMYKAKARVLTVHGQIMQTKVFSTFKVISATRCELLRGFIRTRAGHKLEFLFSGKFQNKRLKTTQHNHSRMDQTPKFQYFQ